MRSGGALLLAVAVAGAAAHPLSTLSSPAPGSGGGPVSQEMLDEIHTFAAFTHAAYCDANIDGAVGNAVCSGGGGDDGSSSGGGGIISNNSTGTGTSSAVSAVSSSPSPESSLCAVFGGAVTAVEFTEDDAQVAGNIVINDARRLVVVSFRGSDRWADVWRNLRVWRTDASALCAGCSAHSGFWAAFADVRVRLDAAVDAATTRAGPRGAYRVVLTGHSLGGAVAGLAAVHLRRRREGLRVDLFTYGAPRVGNQALADAISAGPGRTAHVVNEDDPVPSQPPPYWGYASVVPEYWFRHGIAKPAYPENLRLCDGTDVPSSRCSATVGGWLPVLYGGLRDHYIKSYSNDSRPCGDT